MRLGQLARKLSLRPSQLVDFLAENNIQSEEGSNTKLADAHTEMIVKHFAPESFDEIMNPVIQVTQIEVPVVEEKTPVEEVIEKIEEPVVAIDQPVVTEETSTEQAIESEVIRVQKIELSGLKVLGKIDLPEPKKKEPKAEGDASSTEEKPERKGRNQRKLPRTEREQREWRNPVEAQRKREARELEERKKADLERERERKKNHYQSKVKQVQRPKKTKGKEAVITAKKPKDTRPVPKTWIGKFFRWWTT